MIFFDAVGTLIRLPRGVGFHYAGVARRHGWELEERALTEAFRVAWRTMPARPATRAPRPDDDKGWWRELVFKVLDCCEARADLGRREVYFEELYAEFTRPGVWELYPEAQSVLEELSRTWTLGVISNFDGRLRTILDGLGVSPLFQHVVISSEAGADKPAPAIFERALQLAGVDAAQVLHVGDDPELDWRGAEAAGFRVFRLERPRNSLRDLVTALRGS